MADGSSGVTDPGTVVVEADRIVDESPGSGTDVAAFIASANESQDGELTSSDGASSDSGDKGTSSSDQLIPSDTRQRLLPFLISPANSENLGSQMFSFRPSEKNVTNTGYLNIMPSDRDEYKNDLGLKYLVSKYVRDGGFGVSDPQATRDVILNNLPAIRIREYTQDTKLELLWGLLKNGIEGFKAGKDAAEDTQKERLAKTLDITADQATKFAESMASSIKDPSFWEQVVDEISKTSEFNIQKDFYVNKSIKTKLILELVYALYYRMIGATTTNVYILPFAGTDIISTNGADGWGGPNSWGGSTSANSIFGKFFNFALGSNVKIVSEPIWGGSSGGGGSGVSVTLSLFNDTYDSAMMNFIFVNTIFPQNMFLQYGIFQQPPSVYDIQIEGSRRWFMCSGTFSCNYKGVMRNMTDDFVGQLFKKHGNPYLTNRMSPSVFINNKNVKIPDVYEVTLNFTSLLPDNFNQYLFQYAMKNSITRSAVNREESWYDGPTSTISKWLGEKFGQLSQKAAKSAGVDAKTVQDKIKEAEQIKDEVVGSGDQKTS